MNGPLNAEAILTQAAEAAVRLLPAIEKEAADHIDKANKLQLRITQLRALVSAAGLRFDSAPVVQTRQNDLPLGTKPGRGKVKSYIDDILAQKEGLTEGEIRAEMLLQFGIECGRSTLYSNLASGRENGQYRTDDGKWYLHR